MPAEGATESLFFFLPRHVESLCKKDGWMSVSPPIEKLGVSGEKAWVIVIRCGGDIGEVLRDWANSNAGRA